MIYFLALTNFMSFCLFGIDKYKAIKNHYRISENTLLLSCLLFSAFGGLLGMFIFHHKTKKWKFKLLVPLMLVIEGFILFKIG